MPIRRSDASARRAIRFLTWFALLAVVMLLLEYLPGEKTPLKYLIIAAGVAFVIFGPPVDSIVARLAKAWAPHVKDNDLLWRGARLILTVKTITFFPFRIIGRGARRAAVWFAETSAGRFADRHRRHLSIILTAVIAYRVMTLAGLVSLGGQATILDWAVFGFGYGLFGVTAPFVALMAAMMTREWAVVTFIIWHMIALVCVLLAFFVALYGSATGGVAPHYAANLTPLASLGVLFGELLLHLFALRWSGPIKGTATPGPSQPTGA